MVSKVEMELQQIATMIFLAVDGRWKASLADPAALPLDLLQLQLDFALPANTPNTETARSDWGAGDNRSRSHHVIPVLHVVTVINIINQLSC